MQCKYCKYCKSFYSFVLLEFMLLWQNLFLMLAVIVTSNCKVLKERNHCNAGKQRQETVVRIIFCCAMFHLFIYLFTWISLRTNLMFQPRQHHSPPQQVNRTSGKRVWPTGAAGMSAWLTDSSYKMVELRCAFYVCDLQLCTKPL